MTDSASAAQYGVQTARLSRAGDDTPERRFVAPDQAGMASAAQALTAKAVPGFLEPNPTTAPPDAYPLTALTYGAATPLSLDTTARHEYAAFIDYAAGPGQEPGVEYGQLPRGYLPLPDGLRAQATAAAAAIRDAKVPDEIQALASATGAAQASGSPQSSAASPSAGPPTSGATASSPTRGSGPSTTNGGGRDPQPAPRPRKPLKAVIEAVPRLLRTQAYRLAATRYALPVLVAVALLAGLGALELSKRRSRLAAAHPPGPPDTLDGGEVV